MLRFKMCVALFAVIAMALVAGQVNAGVVYSEDFEDAGNPQPMTAAAFGWSTTWVNTHTATVTSGTNLPTDAVDACLPENENLSTIFQGHAVSSPTGTMDYTLEADIYGNSLTGFTDSSIGLSVAPIGAPSPTDVWADSGAWLTITNIGVWRLDARGIGGGGDGYVDFAEGGLDEVVNASIKLDFTANTVTGKIVGSTTGTISQTLSMDPALALTLQTVRLAVNDADEGVFDVDNIVITEGTSETLLGDLDDDGFVGGSDLDIIRSFWGQTVTPGNKLHGDPSGDGECAGDDLDLVRAHWGEGTPPGPAGVPEPSALILLASGVIGVLLARRRR